MLSLSPPSLTSLRTSALAGVAIVGLFAASYVASSVVTRAISPPSSSSAALPSSLPGGDVAAGAISRTDRGIGVLQERLRQQPNDARAMTQLGQAYLQKARETSDPSYYTRAEGLFTASLAQTPDDANALAGMGSLTLARHEFATGLDWGERALAVQPVHVAALAVVADAQVELGRYQDAVSTVQRLVDFKPTQPSYARVAYLRELHGDLAGAAAAMQAAVDAGAPGTEPTEWTRVQLGHLQFQMGDLAAAEETYQRSLAALPSFVYAQGGLARVKAARGELAGAIELYEAATVALPVPELVAGLADAYRAAGRPLDAEAQDEVVRATQALFRANGVNTDLDLALFDLDRGQRVEAALQTARGQWAERKSVHVADVLAWGLYREGSCQEAAAVSADALRLGTRDPLMLYRASQIAACAGDSARAAALAPPAIRQHPSVVLRYGPQS